MLKTLITTAAMILTTAAAAETLPARWAVGKTVSGLAITQVLDGDTLRVRDGRQDVNIRLAGIDAHEWGQVCTARSGRVPCGELATQALTRLIDGVTVACRSARMHGYCLTRSAAVACRVTDHDRTPGRAPRPVAVCRTTRTADLGAELVRAGLAAPAYGTQYEADYRRAAAIGAGMHRTGVFADPRNSPKAYRRQ